MDQYLSAAELVRNRRPHLPVLGLRPHLAERAARWFLDRFPGRVLYAWKSNNSPDIIAALHRAGIRHYDVASLVEIAEAHGLPGAVLHLMNPIKSRETIARAYFDFGVRSFAVDHPAELDKILAVTGNARDLELHVRLACPNRHSLVPLDGKFGANAAVAPDLLMRARQIATRLGVTFHVGSQAMDPASYREAMHETGRVLISAGVLVDYVDVGGGFPSRYPGCEPPPLEVYINTIAQAFEAMPVSEGCELICEPGRALVAESESLIVRVEHRRGQELYINDGSYGALFDAAHTGLVYPMRRVGQPETGAALQPFLLWGPTCDSIDKMPGPFLLPGDIDEGDYIEIGQVGAYGRVLAGPFNGFGRYDEVELADGPLMSMYEAAEKPASTVVAFPRGPRR